MATHDYVLNNQNGALFRADINSALQAIVTNNSSPTAPVPTYPFMMWADTTTGILKQRNAANTAWINIYNYASPGIIDAVNFHTGTLLTAWTTYTPAITSTTGAITSSSTTGAFKQIGKTVHVRIQCSITNNGTGTGHIRITLPLNMVSNNFAIAGRESGLTGFTVVGVGGGTNILNVFRYDNDYAGGTGANLILAGTYESV